MYLERKNGRNYVIRERGGEIMYLEREREFEKLCH